MSVSIQNTSLPRKKRKNLLVYDRHHALDATNKIHYVSALRGDNLDDGANFSQTPSTTADGVQRISKNRYKNLKK